MVIRINCQVLVQGDKKHALYYVSGGGCRRPNELYTCHFLRERFTVIRAILDWRDIERWKGRKKCTIPPRQNSAYTTKLLIEKAVFFERGCNCSARLKMTFIWNYTTLRWYIGIYRYIKCVHVKRDSFGKIKEHDNAEEWGKRERSYRQDVHDHREMEKKSIIKKTIICVGRGASKRGLSIIIFTH